MKRQIIKTRPQRPYIIVRIVLVVTAATLVLVGAYELAVRAGLHFH